MEEPYVMRLPTSLFEDEDGHTYLDTLPPIAHRSTIEISFIEPPVLDPQTAKSPDSSR